MRSFLIFFALLLSASVSAQERATAWQGKTADGAVLHFDPAHLQRPAILFFWATWCPYCEALMPHVQAVYTDSGKQALDVFAIDIKDDGDPVATLKERGATFQLIVEGDSIADQYGIRGTPGLLLVDRNGTIVYRRVGGQGPDQVEAELRRQLGKLSEGPKR